MSSKKSEISKVKQQLRTEKTIARNELSSDQRSKLSSEVCHYALEWLETKGITSLMAYVSFRSELDTRPLITQAWKDQRKVLLPRVIPASGEMSIHAVNAWSDLEPGAYGIQEPIVSSRDLLEIEEIKLPAVVFVPGLAFDLQGGRLGYGRGYYDRLRASWEKAGDVSAQPPIWIGLAYGMQLVPRVPMDEHDALMDMLITENGIVHCRKGE
ncbi:5-formyltetrahydrofolate cyclo-ligase [Paenibacillus odorifer]|uniref:5-formyltetrahydrofolate cyclo-ligase n=1 Tax=Paenibacillus odorifer TaxID=189426 RepID=A0ABX3GJY0_9BACL|nr:5-formyltetrahydrofolate cyclo-ligase [Paenibacillus odorifer]OMD26211.1 5-formyltetrahydrofolate cyclo-ligase [Paenibacillus odorifer]